MGFPRVDMVDIELSKGTLFRSFANKMIGEGDEKANKFGGRVTRNGSSVNLNGSTVTGYFIRQDHNTVIMYGECSGNEFFVKLPEECYNVEGAFTLAIKISNGGETQTLRVIDGTVINTMIGGIVDPGAIFPDYAALIAEIERAEAAAETIAGLSIQAELISGDNYKIVITHASE